MTKTRSTKSALISAILALALTLTSFVGTTFAWFTDSVTSANNIIQSGNLDIELEYWDGTEYVAVTDSTELFNSAALWEPGYTEVAYLKVSNLGSLALKYQLNVNVYSETLGKNKDGDDIKLSDYLVFSVVDKEIASAADLYTRDEAVAAAGDNWGLATYNGETAVLENTGDADYVALIIYMPESVGNSANHDGTNVPSISMGVKLLATQYTSEEDGFGSDYDEDAWVEGFNVTTATELVAAIESGETNLVLQNDIVLDEQIVIPEVASTFAMRSAPAPFVLNLNGKSISIDGSTAIRNEGNLVITGSGKISSKTGYAIRVQKGSLLIDSDDIEVVSDFGAISMFNDAQVTINGGTYTVNGSAGKTHHCIYLYSGADLVVNGGTFAHNGAGISDSGATLTVYAGEGGGVTINGGTFTGSGSYISAFDKYDSKCYIVITGGSFTKDPKSYVAEGYKVEKTGDKIWTVSYDGSVVSNAEELVAALATGGKILLKNDISYDAAIVLSAGTILDGNGKSITYGGSDYTYHLLKMYENSELKNVTLNNYRVRTENNTSGTVTLTNVTIDMDNEDTGLDISRGAGVAKLTGVVCKSITDAAHLDPNTQVQAEYTPYGDVLLGTKWGLEAVDCEFGTLHGWNTTNNSSVSLTGCTATVIRMHYWPNRALTIDGVETTWADSGAIPVAHDVGGCWSVQPAFR